jgi:hypothetical protein
MVAREIEPDRFFTLSDKSGRVVTQATRSVMTTKIGNAKQPYETIFR